MDDDRIRTLYERLADRYASGEVPWDEQLPPPEVLDLLPTLKPGKALDLGCGYGRASLYMANLGWEVDAIDFIPVAIAEAARRATIRGVKVRFHLCEVSELDFLCGPYDFALDVGCCHNLDDGRLKRLVDHLTRLLVPGAIFLLFARLRDENDQNGDGPHGLLETTIENVFHEGFGLEWSDIGLTEVEDNPPWASGWFRFRRRP